MTTVTTAPPTARDGAPPRPTRASALRRWVRRGGASSVALALPAVLVFGLFSWWPMVRGVVMSVQRTNFVTAPTFVGLDNFTYVLSDPRLGTAVANTAWFAVLAILVGFPAPILLAVVVSTVTDRRRRWFTVVTYLPAMVPPVVAILLWKVFFDPSPQGVLNQVLGWFGLGPLLWLNSATTAMPSIVLEATWAGAGTATLVYLATLTSVRAELYEAATLDGAGVGRRLWHVTLPQMRGMLLVMMLLQLIGAAQVFAEPYLFTGGGPQNATLTVLLLVYSYAFVNADYGAATALSVLLAVSLAALSLAYYGATRRWSAS